ncbi:MAG: hypothetical protein GQ569_11735 [Methylococcaceae bacterium]|nr:hypothetical protein [Methylococcaceae bacterium]
MNTQKILERQQQESLAAQYQSNGFEVTLEPNADKIPFDLNGYRPDILASRENLNLIIEIKNSVKKVSVEHLQAVSELISEHKSWRFVLITLDDIKDDVLAGTEDTYPSWIEIDTQAEKTSAIIDTIGYSAALIYIWSLVEAALRRYAFESSIPIERLPFSRIIKHLYSIGVLSMEELNTLISLQNIRNQAAHGSKVEISRNSLDQLIEFTHKAVSNLRLTA